MSNTNNTEPMSAKDFAKKHLNPSNSPTITVNVYDFAEKYAAYVRSFVPDDVEEAVKREYPVNEKSKSRTNVPTWLMNVALQDAMRKGVVIGRNKGIDWDKLEKEYEALNISESTWNIADDAFKWFKEKLNSQP